MWDSRKTIMKIGKFLRRFHTDEGDFCFTRCVARYVLVDDKSFMERNLVKLTIAWILLLCIIEAEISNDFIWILWLCVIEAKIFNGFFQICKLCITHKP